MISSINFQFAENVEIVMGFPTISRSNMSNSIHDLVIFSRFLQIKLIAWESQNREFVSVGAVFFNYRVEV